MASPGAIQAAKAYVELALEDGRLQRGLGQAQRRLRRFGQDVAAMGGTMLGAATGLLAPVGAALKTFSEIGDNAAKMARRTGVSVEAIQALGFAAERAGTDSKALETGLRRMQRSIYDAGRGLSTQTDALKDLGLSYQDLAGRKPEEQFKTLAGALSRVGDASRRAALAQAVFGRSGTMLLPMFEEGAEGLDRMIERFEDLGVTLSASDAKAAEAFTDTMTDLWTSLKYGVALVGAALDPAVRDLVGSAQDWLKEAAAWVRENRDLIVSYGKLAVKIGLWIGGIGAGLVVVGKLITSVGALIGLVKALSVAFAGLAANPIGAIAAGVAALAIAYETAVRHAADLSREQARLLEGADRERAADLAKLNRLRDIQAKHEKTNADIAEARRLIDDLEGKYGDLGLSVNKATGEVSGLAGGMERLAGAMQTIVQTQLESALAEARKNLRELRKEREAEGKSLMRGAQTFATWAAGGDVDAPIRRMLDRESEAARRIADLETRLADLGSGTAEVLTGGAAAAGAGGPAAGILGAGGDEAAEAGARAAEQQADLEQRLLDRLVSQRIDAFDEEHTRRMAAIRQRYAEERARLEAQGATAKAIGRLEQIREGELAAERRRHQEQIFDEAGREADAWYEKQIRAAEEEQRLRDQIAREQVSAMEEGPLKELARLDLEREIARGQAATEEQARMIDRLYGLRAQTLAKAESFTPNLETVGTFSAFFDKIFGGRTSEQERAAKAAEETAEQTAEMNRRLRGGIDVNIAYGG